MNETQKTKIAELRYSGYSYGKIAQMMGISINTIKTFCRRHCTKPLLVKEVTTSGTCFCHNCGTEVVQNEGRKLKKFCSDKCRNVWWNSHLNLVKKKANYEYVCPTCNNKFVVYGNSHRKYCSHMCYISARFGGENNEG